MCKIKGGQKAYFTISKERAFSRRWWGRMQDNPERLVQIITIMSSDFYEILTALDINETLGPCSPLMIINWNT